MQYIPIGKGKWIELNEVNDTSRVIVLSEIEKQIEQMKDESKGLDKSTDDELLAWAKVNFPYSKEAEKHRILTAMIVEKQELLTKLK